MCSLNHDKGLTKVIGNASINGVRCFWYQWDFFECPSPMDLGLGLVEWGPGLDNILWTLSSPEHHVSHVLPHFHVWKKWLKLKSVDSSVWKVFLKTSQHFIQFPFFIPAKISIKTQIHKQNPIFQSHPLWFTIHFQSSMVRFDLASKSSVILQASSFILDPL